MKTWTTQAEKRLSEYLDARARREGFEGEDAEELKADLRRHIHEEAERELTDGIGLMQLEGLLGRLDAGYRPPAVPAKATPAKAPRPFWLWTWGVMMPAGVAVFEMISSFCGGAFFDPLPTLGHVLLVLLVPLINAWFLNGAPRGSAATQGFAAGLAVTVAVFYALLFLPLVPLSLLALIAFGMGLLSLTPVFAGVWTWRIGRRLRRESPDAPRFARGWKAGLATALVGLVALEGPALWTRANLNAATGEEAARQAAIGRLRGFHSERVLLAACYEGNRRSMAGGTDISGWITSGWRVSANFFTGNFLPPPETEEVRDLFFRITGKPFNSLKPPRQSSLAAIAGSRGGADREWEFDDHLGGDDVAVRLKHLDLAESRFDGHLDPRSRLGYGEWTMVFENRARNALEARCQVLLPRGGRVSRLTLWVNGEEREAAFSSVSNVKAAYREIAVVQRRDPVLVTQCGPDTILMQCFPVPPGGTMKIRFGITAPLDGGLWEMPRVLERNFGTKEGLEHAVWLQGDGPFEMLERGGPPRTSITDGPRRSLLAALPATAITGGPHVVKAAVGPGEPPAVWCEDNFAAAHERYLTRELKPVRRAPSGKLLVVIDGSASLAAEKPWIVEALRGTDASILLADDGVREATLQDLEAFGFSGGRDNEPALREAVRRAKAGEAGEIVWIHGPQAVGLSQTEALLQMIERGSRLPVVHEVMAVTGPNRLSEALHRSGALRRGPALLDPRADLTALLSRLSVERDETAWHWRRSASPPEGLGTPVWDHLARQWAIEAVDSPLSGIPETDRPALAARYQLVTRVSGAVVLETMEQFKRHGLKPVDANSVPQVPGVPEPSSALLVCLGAALAAGRRRRPPRG